MKKQIIIFGYGYVSKFLIQQLKDHNWTIYCTSRKIDVEKPVKDGNVTVINFLDSKLPYRNCLEQIKNGKNFTIIKKRTIFFKNSCCRYLHGNHYIYKRPNCR